MATEQELIAKIKELPNHKVFYGRDGYSVTVAHEISNENGGRTVRCKQTSVWLGRKNTIANLQSILDGRLQ